MEAEVAKYVTMRYNRNQSAFFHIEFQAFGVFS